jgi:translocation and assembly module TamB
MKSFLRKFFWSILLIIGIVLTTLLWVTNTDHGSRWLIQTASKLSGQLIIVHGIEGTLASNISLKELKYNAGQDGISITLNNLNLKLNARALLDKTLHIQSLSAEEITVTLDASPAEESEQTKTAFSPPEFSLPLTLLLDSLTVKKFTIDGQETPLQIDNILLAAKMQNSDLTVKQLQLQQTDLHVNAHSQIRFSPPFDLQTSLQLDKQSSNAKAKLEIDGTMQKYKINGMASLNKVVSKDEKAIPVDVDFSGTGSLTDLELKTFNLKTLDGFIKGTGKVQWSDELQANLSFNGENLDPSIINEDMPGDLVINGSLKLENNNFDTQLKITGQLRDYPLNLQIKADGSPENIHLKQGQFQNGPNHLTLTGKLTKQTIKNLSWQLNAPKLSTLHQQLGGQLTGNGQINGSWQQLTGSGNLQGKMLRFQDSGIESFDLKLEPLPTQKNTPHYQIELNGNALTVAQTAIEKIKITTTGSLKEQQTDYRIVETNNALQGHISSQKDKQQWRVEISETQLKSKHWPILIQPQTARLNITPKDKTLDAELTDFCLQGANESLCLKGQHSLHKTNALLTLKDIPIQRFKPWVAATGDLKDILNGKVDINQVNDNWTFQSNLLLDDTNKLNTNIKLNQKTKSLSGSINVNVDKLVWLELFSDQLMQPEGKVVTQLNLGGTLKQPEVTGKLQLIAANTKLPDAGIELSDLNLAINTIDVGHAKIIGNVKSSDSEMQLTGTTKWLPLDEWQLKLKLTGENFQLVNLTEVQASASPDLDVLLQSEKIEIKGTIKLPVVMILLEDLPENAVTISKDAQIISDTDEQIAKPDPTPIYADIKLQLGEDVRLDGKGLEVRLGGQLNIRQTPGKPIQANGKIDILEGIYTAYGQDLELHDSSIIFNGPVSQPGLNLKAQRKVDNVTVGLLVRGTLENPQSEIFSIPAMPESDAISYLLTGKPLDSAGSEDGALIASAITKLGVKGSAGLIEEVRNTTGLSTLEIESGSDTEQTALLIGKYLTPDLYVQYVKRLFLDSDSLQLKYRINENLKLKGESGTSQGIDLIYQFEK